MAKVKNPPSPAASKRKQKKGKKEDDGGKMDARFFTETKNKSKVKVDSRFSRMFTDPAFRTSYEKDSRGRVLPKEERTDGENLEKYYELEGGQEENTFSSEESGKEEEEEEGEKEEQELEETKKGNKAKGKQEERQEERNYEDSDDTELQSTRAWMQEWPSGGSSDEEPESDFEEEEDEESEDIPDGDEAKRLAVMDLDWTHIQAEDAQGSILKVSVYPSEFGEEQMKKEETAAPDVWGDDDKFDPEKLRKYEKQKLRYYFAVVECDSVQTASAIYNAADGMEVGHSSNVIDLRYIPDNVEFSKKPRDTATKVKTNYKAPDFYTRALQHTNVDMSWDASDPKRDRILKRDFTAGQLDEDDFRAFLASSSSEDEYSDDEVEAEGTFDEEADSVTARLRKRQQRLRGKYLSLLGGGSAVGRSGASDEEGDMEVTFVPGFADVGKEKDAPTEGEERGTVWEDYLAKRKEKKKQRRANAQRHANKSEEEKEEDGALRPATTEELELLTMDKVGHKDMSDSDDEEIRRRGKKSRKERKRKRELLEQRDQADAEMMDLDDPRFQALYTSEKFDLDPSAPQFKATAANKLMIAKKRKMRIQEREEERERVEQRVSRNEVGDDVDLSALVGRVKEKTRIKQKKLHCAEAEKKRAGEQPAENQKRKRKRAKRRD